MITESKYGGKSIKFFISTINSITYILLSFISSQTQLVLNKQTDMV